MDRADPAAYPPMDHADVMDRLEEAFLGPGHLAAIESDTTAEGRATRMHLADCEECRAEYEALARTGRLLAIAAPEALGPSPAVRDRVLAAAATIGRTRPVPAPGVAQPSGGRAVGRPWGRPGMPVLVRRTGSRASTAFAAAAVILLLVGGMLVGPLLTPGRTPEPGEVRGLGATGEVMDRLLADPTHRAATLVDAEGDPAGTVLIGGATGELAVVSTALERPPDDVEYSCFIVRRSERTWIGTMHFRGDTAYWAGHVDVVDAGRAGDGFVVILEGAGNDPALSGQF
jgi:hypothetical protein